MSLSFYSRTYARNHLPVAVKVERVNKKKAEDNCFFRFAPALNGGGPCRNIRPAVDYARDSL
jgi:hypothetical protein